MRVQTTSLTPTEDTRVDALNIRLLGMHIGFVIGGSARSRKRVTRLALTCGVLFAVMGGIVLAAVAR